MFLFLSIAHLDNTLLSILVVLNERSRMRQYKENAAASIEFEGAQRTNYDYTKCPFYKDTTEQVR